MYNVEPYLKQCLDSVIGQTYRNLEILIIDDGSTDRSGEVCDEYAEKDNRIRVFHTENRGLSAARNLGIDKANGDYIAFLDSDDWFELDAIEITVREACRTEADIVCFRYVREYKDTSRKESSEYSEKKTFNGSEILKDYCIGKTISGAAWDKLYKKMIFSDVRFPDNRYFEDTATAHLFLLRAKRVLCIPDILIHYRARVNGISRGHKLKHVQDQWLSSIERFEGVSRISREYGDGQIGHCIGTIGKMWSWYSGFSKEEKKQARHLLESMKEFSSVHRNDVMKSSNVSRFYKIVCLCSLTTNPLMMRSFYALNQAYRHFRKQEELFE